MSKGSIHAIVPQAGAGVVGVALRLVLVAYVFHKGILFGLRPGLAARLEPVAAHRGQYVSCLFAPHHGDAGVGPGPQHIGGVGTTAHGVVAGAMGSADHHREFGNPGAGHGGDHLGAVLGDAFVFVFLAHHEACDVLQEQERDAAPVGQLDEVRAFHGALGKQNAIVRQYGDRIAFHMGKAADQGFPVQGLELVQLAAVHQPSDHLAHIVGRAGIFRQHAVKLRWIGLRFHRLAHLHREPIAKMAGGDDLPRQGQGMLVVGRQVIGNTGCSAVHIAAAERLRIHLFAGRRLDQRRPA